MNSGAFHGAAVLLSVLVLSLACRETARPVTLGPGCTLRRVVFENPRTTVAAHYDVCPAPAFVDAWTVDLAGERVTYSVAWDRS